MMRDVNWQRPGEDANKVVYSDRGQDAVYALYASTLAKMILYV